MVFQVFLAGLSSVGLLVCILATLSSIHTKVSACCACVRVKAVERCVAARVVRYRAAFVSWRIGTVAPRERAIPQAAASRQSRPNDDGDDLLLLLLLSASIIIHHIFFFFFFYLILLLLKLHSSSY